MEAVRSAALLIDSADEARHVLSENGVLDLMRSRMTVVNDSRLRANLKAVELCLDGKSNL